VGVAAYVVAHPPVGHGADDFLSVPLQTWWYFEINRVPSTPDVAMTYMSLWANWGVLSTKWKKWFRSGYGQLTLFFKKPEEAHNLRRHLITVEEIMTFDDSQLKGNTNKRFLGPVLRHESTRPWENGYAKHLDLFYVSELFRRYQTNPLFADLLAGAPRFTLASRGGTMFALVGEPRQLAYRQHGTRQLAFTMHELEEVITPASVDRDMIEFHIRIANYIGRGSPVPSLRLHSPNWKPGIVGMLGRLMVLMKGNVTIGLSLCESIAFDGEHWTVVWDA
jgi:hypothetical protein